MGILKGIQYPTGGTTTFDYETNDYGLENYKYKTGSSGITAFAACCADPAVNPVIHSGNDYYVDKTFSPNATIPAALQSKNPTVPFNFQFSANFDGYDNKCCKGCSTPIGYFKDITTNTVLIQVSGLTNTTTIGAPTFSQDIQSQIANGGANVTQIGNTINISGIQLDPSHTYELYSKASTCAASKCQEFSDCPNITHNMEMYATANYTYATDEVDQYNGVLGGLRVSKITSTASSGDTKPLIKKYQYLISGSPENKISSGVVSDFPEYIDVEAIRKTYQAFKDQGFAYVGFIPVNIPVIKVSNTYNVYTLTSGSKFELGQTSGSFVGYKEVREIICQDGNCDLSPIGKNVYQYSTSADFPDISSGVFGTSVIIGGYTNTSPCPTPPSSNDDALFGIDISAPSLVPRNLNIFPYPPKSGFDWKRGLLISKTSYNASGAVIYSSISKYNFGDEARNRKTIPAFKIVENSFDAGSAPQRFYFGKYDYIAAWNYKTQDKITEYDPNGNNPVSTTTNYFYDNGDHGMLTRTETINSKGETLQSINKYPGDEGAISNLLASEIDAISKLKTQFRYSSLLEKEANKNGALQNRTRTNYKDWGANLIAPESTKFQVGTAAMETRVNFQKYDNTNGNLLQVNKTQGAPIAYQWGYQGEYVVAQVLNAKANDIFYKGFEEGTGNSGLEDRRTGHYSHTGAYNKRLTNLDAGNYILRCWKNVSGVWSLSIVPVTVTGTSYPISLNAQIDDVCFYPVDSQMTTYTYDPLVGMTSMTDVKGLVTTYEYDGLQRLKNPTGELLC